MIFAEVLYTIKHNISSIFCYYFLFFTLILIFDLDTILLIGFGRIFMDKILNLKFDKKILKLMNFFNSLAIIFYFIAIIILYYFNYFYISFDLYDTSLIIFKAGLFINIFSIICGIFITEINKHKWIIRQTFCAKYFCTKGPSYYSRP